MSMLLLSGIIHLTTYQMSTGDHPGLSSVCRGEGRFPVPHLCEEYVECVAGHEGNNSITPRLHRCPGGSYHSKLARCLDRPHKSTCGRTGGEALRKGRKAEHTGVLYRSPRHDHLCVGRLGFACASCVEVVVCAGQEAFLSPCPGDMRCVAHDIFPGGVCYPRWPQDHCSCTAAGQVIPDMYDHKAFLQCTEDHQSMNVFYCDDLHMFDAETLTCVAVPTVPACSSTGKFPVAGECRWYFSCVPGSASGWQQSYHRCPANKVYSQKMAGCVDPQSLAAEAPCSSRRKVTRYTCTFWQLLLVLFFPKHIDYFCSSF